jgi:sulfur-oxidizing protein SoxB
MGERISDLMIGGKPVEPGKFYKAAGWASMQAVNGPPCAEVVTNYLRSQGKVRIEDRNRVRLIG